ncbi:DUF4116 domain-containing protein, partial [Endozoicomonas sp. ONNA1]
LSFFSPGGGLDCLANPIKLSMSPQRSELLAETRDNVNRLIHGAEAMLVGYEAFLQLTGKSCSREVQSLRDEFPKLSNRFVTLKETIRSGLESIITPMQAAEEGQVSQRVFRQWVADCHQLQSCLQALTPSKAERVRSVHELIFALHQRFVEALAPVALTSRQGRVSEEENVTYVDFTTSDNSGGQEPLLNPSGKASIKKLRLSGTAVIIDDALIVNLNLGAHKGVVELLENAEGGKGRTLRLKFSDQFDKISGWEKAGKLKRMWFLVKLLKAIELREDAGPMKLSCNGTAGEIIVECPRMSSRQSMQEAFKKLMIVLHSMDWLDIHFAGRISNGVQWNFNMLAQRLNDDVATEADRFDFQHCLFSMFYGGGFHIDRDCCRLLSNPLQQFIHYARRLAECEFLVSQQEKSEDSLHELLMSDEIAEGTRSELLHHYLLEDTVYAPQLIEQVYGLSNQYFVINPSWCYRLEFYLPPAHPLSDDKDKVRNILLNHGLKYASQRILNDRELVLAAIAEYPDDLMYASKELKNDNDVVIAAVSRNGLALDYASRELKGNTKVVMAAVSQNGLALIYASPELQDNKEVVMAAVANEPDALRYASKRLRSDKKNDSNGHG